MKKNKRYLIFSAIILSFVIVNCVSAENINTSPTEPPVPTLMRATTQKLSNTPTPVNERPETLKTQKPNLVPSLIQQEIEKAKALNNRTGQTNIPNNNLQNTNQNQGTLSNTEQSKQNRSDEIKNRRTEQIRRYSKNIAERFKALIARELQIKNRIQTRVEKLEENGFDMSSAKQLLSEINFEIINEKVNSLRNEILTTTESQDREMIENLFKRIKTETVSLKKETQNIHTKLVQVIKTTREEITKNNQENDETTNE